jgi:DNA-binding winged helix-turn-helix (wHTH) protein
MGGQNQGLAAQAACLKSSLGPNRALSPSPHDSSQIHHEQGTSEWDAVCWHALHAVSSEQRWAILAELAQILRGDVIKCDTVSIDFGRAEVTRDGKPIHLTRLEFQLLRYLVVRAGTFVTRRELLSSVWRYDGSAATRTVEVHLSHLRQKLEQERQAKLIVSVRGLGYKFVATSDCLHDSSKSG